MGYIFVTNHAFCFSVHFSLSTTLRRFLQKHIWAISSAALLTLFLARIVSLYGVYSDTYDEHAHISETLRWIEEGRFAADGFQSPLPRLAIAAGPYFSGFRSDTPWMADDWSNPDLSSYWRSLTLGRLGVLPFAVLLFVTVAFWSRQMYGAAGSLATLFVFSFSPSVLGHSSLATLDVPGAAGTTLALLALWRWMQKPSPLSALLVGAAIGFAQMTKFTGFGFVLIPALGATAFLLFHKRQPLRLMGAHFALIACGAFAVIWPSYGFEVGPIHSYRHERAAGTPAELPLGAFLQEQRTFAPSFWSGFVDMAYLQNGGRPATFMGQASRNGWPSYFPATLLFKATPPFLILAAIGFFLSLATPRRPRATLFLTLAILGMFVVSMPSRVNVGVRHLMPVFPLLSLLAGAAFIGLRAHPKRAAIVMGLLCWHTAESVAAHPDYLAYFTPPLRQEDYYYLSDSNLAWGQDRWRLVEWLEAHSDLDVHVFGAEGIGMLKAIDWTNGPDDSSWVIIDANAAAIILTEHTDDAFARMVRSRPWGRVGRSMLIYKRDAGEGSAP